MTAARVTVAALQDCFVLVDAGRLLHKARPRELFQSDRSWRRFLSQFAGKTADDFINAQGYRRVKFRVSGASVSMNAHRVVFALSRGRMPGPVLDHINCDRKDNRIENLREVTVSENRQNVRRAASSNTSGVLGAHKSRGKFKVSVSAGGAYHWGGYFSTAEEAHAKYVEMKRLLHPGCTL